MPPPAGLVSRVRFTQGGAPRKLGACPGLSSFAPFGLGVAMTASGLYPRRHDDPAYRDPLAIRRTLIETPGHATNIWPYRTLLAIDCLYGSPERTAIDISLLEQRYAGYAPHPRKEFDDFVASVRKWILTG